MPSKSDAQRGFMGVVQKCKMTGDCPSETIRKAAESMTNQQITDFVHTKGNLPAKTKKTS